MTASQKYGEGKEQLMIQNIEYLLSNKVEAMLWHIRLPVFDNVTAKRISTLNSKVYRVVFCSDSDKGCQTDHKGCCKSKQEFLRQKN